MNAANPNSASPQLELSGRAQLVMPVARFDLPDTVPGYLLAYLGANGDWIAREELVDAFWPDAALAQGQAKLRVALNRLRERLVHWGAADALECERRRVRWTPGSDVARARLAKAAGDWAGASAICGGVFAPGLSFRGLATLQDWASDQRHALLLLGREAVLTVAHLVQPSALAQLAARQLQADPLDEALMRVRLGALAILQKLDDVAQEFREFDARVTHALGQGASVALRDWVASLRAPNAGAHLPAADTLYGRQTDLERAQTIWGHGTAAPTRWLTITGLAGVGKSSFARALVDLAASAQAQAQSHATTARTVWLSMQDLPAVADVALRLVRVLAKAVVPVRDPIARAGELLVGVDCLVLDNAEHLMGEQAALCHAIARWLDAARQLHVLVTTREPLRHASEVVFPIRSLHVPSQSAELDQRVWLSAPIQMLAAELRRAQPCVDTKSQIHTLLQIAQCVGGLPLGLKLAARWFRAFSATDVLAALQRDLGVLDEAAHGNGLKSTASVATREAGISTALWRSWHMLDASTQNALAALSLYVSPFSADEAVQGGAASLTQLSNLLDAGLLEPSSFTDEVTTTAAPADAQRLHLHALVKAFAHQRLEADAQRCRSVLAQHAHAVRARLLVWHNWRQIDQGQALVSISQLLEDVRQVWRWALENGRPDFIAEAAPVLCNYFERTGRWADGIALFEAAHSALDAAERTELPAIAACARARALMLYRDGRFDAGLELALRALAWARALGHANAIKGTLNTVALCHWMLGDMAQALVAAQEAHELAKKDGDRAGEAVFLGTLGLLNARQGNYTKAARDYAGALAVHREVGNWASAATTLNNLGNNLFALGQWDQSTAAFEECLALSDAYGFVATRQFALVNLARAHWRANRLDAAETLAQQALIEIRRTGERMLEAATLLLLAEVARSADRWDDMASHLAPALRGARAIKDTANLLEALAGFARWAAHAGRPVDAAQALATVLAHPQLHGSLRDEIAADLAKPWALCLPRGTSTDTVALVEQAVSLLDGASHTALSNK